jgi:hypothetical protein
MPKGKHRISKEKAEMLMAGMKERISSPDSPLQGFPEGFIFDVGAVRKLVNHPDAAHFIIRFGWKEDEKVLAPILCVADAKRTLLEESGGEKAAGNTRALMTEASKVPEDDEEAGGYLDEGTKYP